MTLKTSFGFEVNTEDMIRQLEGLEGGFRHIPQKLVAKYLRSAAREGAKVMLKPLKAATKRRKGKGSGQGNLKRSIKTAAKFFQKGSQGGATGVIYYSRKNNLGNHAWLLESGTKDRFVTTRKGKKLSKPAFRGKGPAIHMMRDTRNAYASAVRTKVETLSGEALQKAIDEMIKPRY